MNDTLQDDLAAVRHEAQRLLREQVSGERLEALLDTPGSFDAALWRLVAEQGWPAVGLAEADGGAGLGWAGLSVICEELGRSGAALPVIATAIAAACLTRDPLLDGFRTGLRDGSVKACLALPGLRQGQLHSNAGVQCTGNRLTGEVSTVAFGAVAEVALVAAQGAVWLVALSSAEVSRTPLTTLDDGRAFATLVFANAPAVRLGDTALLALTLDQAAVLTAFEQIGSAQACLTLAIDYAMQREAFGQPVARFQAIKHKLVEIYSSIEIARGCALAALDVLDSAECPDPHDSVAASERHQAAATARVAASQAGEQAARDCINVFGALGLTREAAPHRHYRRARSLALELGSTPIWRESLVAHFLASTALTEKA